MSERTAIQNVTPLDLDPEIPLDAPGAGVFVVDAGAGASAALVERAKALAAAARLSAPSVVPMDAKMNEPGLIVVEDAAGQSAKRVLQLVAETRNPVLVLRSLAAAPYRRVLVAADFSRHASAARKAARRLCPDAELTIAHVWHVPFQGFTSAADVHAAVRQEEMDQLEAIASIEAQRGAWASVRHQLIEGEVVTSLLDVARIEKSELIAMGTRGQSGLVQALVGSVAKELLTTSQSDILLVGL